LKSAAKSVEIATTKFTETQQKRRLPQIQQQQQKPQLVVPAQLQPIPIQPSNVGNVDSPLAVAAKVVIEKMILFSNATTATELIMCSRDLATAVATICNLATEQAQSCKNSMLKDQLLTVSISCKNYSTQLKILSAVKAATEEAEIEKAHQQLVNCCKLLGDSVAKIIDNSRIISQLL